MSHRIIAVGDPPVFRQKIAQAADVPAEAIEWMPTLTAAEELFSGDRGEADVLVISPKVDESDVLALAQLASRFSPTTAVVLVRASGKAENGLLPKFMRAGIRDIVTEPTPDELGEALQRAITWSNNLKASTGHEAAKDLGVVITVFSSKGGTGKTFLATNLAVAIAQRSGRDTAIVDLDLAMGDVFAYFGSEPVRPVQDLISTGAKPDRESILANGTKLGENLWGFGGPPDPGAAEVPAEHISTLLHALKGTFAYTVVDAPAGYSDQILPALDVSDAICLVAGLDIVGVRHLTKAIETLSSIGLDADRLHVIMNRADSKVGLEISDVERVTKIKIDSLIPSSRLVPMSLNHGRPVVLEEPKADVTRAIQHLSDRFLTERARETVEASSEVKKSRFSRRKGKD